MAVKKDRKMVLDLMRKESTGILATYDNNTNEIRLRVMYYGLDNEFNCFLMSARESPKISQILSSSNVTFIVFKEEDPYDKSWELEINGVANLLEEDTDINYALGKLRNRNPFADVALESGITKHFEMIKIVPQLVRFREYGEALKGEPPVTIKF